MRDENERKTRSKLYVVATPIGNLADITPRALQTLDDVSVVFAEDTRVTRKLFSHYDIHTPLKRLDANTEEKGAQTIIEYLKEGKSCALVSDAGTPAISDPGAHTVRAVREAGFGVVAVPGPSALTAALSVAGVPASQFVFLGFPPHKKGRKKFFDEIATSRYTVVLYESTHRILKTLTQLDSSLLRWASRGQARELSDGTIVLVSELTKIHEEVLFGTAKELIQELEERPEKQKGEFVIIITRH